MLEKNIGLSVPCIYAAKYVYEHYLSKEYPKAELWPQELSCGSKDKVTYRPNHGLAHTLRCAMYVPYVLEAYCKQKKIDLSARIEDIQLAILFYVAGRGNEMGSGDNKEMYQEFRKNSALAFEKYIKEKLPKPHLQIYKDILRENADPKDVVALHIQLIMRLAHNLDSLRCFEKPVFQSVCMELSDHLGGEAVNKLTTLAEACVVATGDRVMGGINRQDRNGELFFNCSRNVDVCLGAICEAIKKELIKQRAVLQVSGGSRLKKDLPMEDKPAVQHKHVPSTGSSSATLGALGNKHSIQPSSLPQATPFTAVKLDNKPLPPKVFRQASLFPPPSPFVAKQPVPLIDQSRYNKLPAKK
jgi:hypothetical protein